MNMSNGNIISCVPIWKAQYSLSFITVLVQLIRMLFPDILPVLIKSVSFSMIKLG